jgi:hypothetical protein
VTASNTLPADQVASFRLAEVKVSLSPGAPVGWGDGERAYAASKGAQATESDALAKTPEGQAYIRNAVVSKVKAAMERHLASGMTGSRPVRVEVSIKDITIASALRRVVLGGHHTMAADVTLVDPRTGAVLVTCPGQTSMAMAGQGIAGAVLDQAFLAEPIDRVVDSYANQYRNWLLRT